MSRDPAYCSVCGIPDRHEEGCLGERVEMLEEAVEDAVCRIRDLERALDKALGREPW